MKKLSNNFQTFFIFSSVDEPTIIEDLDAEVQVKPRPESRATPLKSLLKKPSFEVAEPSSSSDTESEDGKISPKKVHFSEIDQVKLMSQESLASMAASEGNEPTILNSLPSSIQCPSVAKVVNNQMLAKQEELQRALGDIDNDQVLNEHKILEETFCIDSL